MMRTIKIALITLMTPLLMVGQVHADSVNNQPGQIEGGPIYLIKNVTQNVDFANPATANPGDVLEYRVRIHNPGPSPITDVMVKATLDSNVSTSHSSTVTVSSASADPTSTSATAVLNLSSAQSISYVPGSTELLDDNAQVISNLPDGITAGGEGIDIGTVNVSITNRRYVEFEVKVGTTPTPPITPPTTPSAPLATAGPESAAAGVGLMSLSAGAYTLRRSRQRLNGVLRQK